MWPLLCLFLLILFQTTEILTFGQYVEENIFGCENWKLSSPKLICDLELPPPTVIFGGVGLRGVELIFGLDSIC